MVVLKMYKKEQEKQEKSTLTKYECAYYNNTYYSTNIIYKTTFVISWGCSFRDIEKLSLYTTLYLFKIY